MSTLATGASIKLLGRGLELQVSVPADRLVLLAALGLSLLLFLLSFKLKSA